MYTYWKCIFPINPYVLLLVGWSVDRSTALLIVRQGNYTLPSSSERICFKTKYFIKLKENTLGTKEMVK